jgi:hypothetical protein
MDTPRATASKLDPSAYCPVLCSPTRKDKDELFGTFEYDDIPGQDGIVIKGKWTSHNIQKIRIPQLAKAVGGSGHVHFHRKGASQLPRLWAEWEKQGLLDLILSWDGAFNPRYKRHCKRRHYVDLSNHAFGTAFDINYKWNKLGKTPAQIGEIGCVRELVPIANDYGFAWGGHYEHRKDGMHFEIARII